MQCIQTISKNHGQLHPYLGGRGVGRLDIHINMVTWSDAGESVMPPNAKAPPAPPTLYLFLVPDLSASQWKIFTDVEES